MSNEEQRRRWREDTARYRQSHPELRAVEREYSAQYHRAHPEKVRERVRKWRLSAGSQLIVYAWVHPDGHVDYVGRGGGKRPYRHRTTPWWTPQHMLLTMTMENEWQAMEYEGKWGGRYRPAQNVDGARR